MATKDEALPETMLSPETGGTLTRGVRPFTVAYKGESVPIGKDMAIVDQALRGLKGKADGVPSRETIHRLRGKLQLSQREARALFKVGENAFDKYERGLVEPSGPTIQLMALLDRHPELARELK
ncbi:MAG: type II TA system antitoxin MqsA family protein [Methylocystis sp.]|uniref:type II TA system antitoxin MqsA family protein n=1 Tax=Methylocystis sp. TaxID=1911079 RepID=UPI003DA673C2